MMEKGAQQKATPDKQEIHKTVMDNLTNYGLRIKGWQEDRLSKIIDECISGQALVAGSKEMDFDIALDAEVRYLQQIHQIDALSCLNRAGLSPQELASRMKNIRTNIRAKVQAEIDAGTM